jgi:hypothetical protein
VQEGRVKYAVGKQSNGLYAPRYVGQGGPLSYDEAKRAADDLNKLLLSGQLDPTKKTAFADYFKPADPKQPLKGA